MVHLMTPTGLRVWWLRVRAAWGWGHSPSSLRQFSRVSLYQAKLALGFAPVFLIAVYLLELIPGYDAPLRLVSLDEFIHRTLVHFWVPLVAMFIAAPLCIIIARVLDIRATKAASQPSIVLTGYCFTTVISQPSTLFALIGATSQRATWFCLPLVWDPVVEPCDDRFELTYNPVTGYVERITRMGVDARELRQPFDLAVRQGTSEATDTNDGEATAPERHELNRLARRAGAGWGVDDVALCVYGISLALGGLFLVALPFFILALVRAMSTSPASSASFTPVYLSLLVCMFIIPGSLLLLWDMRIVREWARRRSFIPSPPSIVEGTQTCWTPYWDWYARGYESLAAVQLQNGDQLLFRVPGYWAHRVRQANTRVRVTYNEQTWRVLDYRPLPPVSA